MGILVSVAVHLYNCEFNTVGVVMGVVVVVCVDAVVQICGCWFGYGCWCGCGCAVV